MGIKIIRSTPLKSLLVALILMSQSQAFALTDQEAADLGMTPVESLEKIQKGQSFDPSIDNLITKAGVVVVVDKSIRTSHRPSGQTATVYVDGHYYSEYDI